MSNNNLKIIFWNANGVTPKLNELSALLYTIKADIVLIGETKTNPQKPIKIRNYHTYRTDAKPLQGRAASGGTALLVHRKIVHKQILLNTSIFSTSIEISINNSITRISSVYNRPSQTLNNSDLNTLTQGCDWFVVAGDLNAKHPTWNSHCENASGSILYNHAQSVNDYEIIAPDSPTFYPLIPGHRPDVLDVALVKLPNLSVEIVN